MSRPRLDSALSPSCLVLCLLLTANAVWAAPPADQDVSPADRSVPDLGTVIDANEISMFVTNRGSWAYDQLIGDAGLEWPKGTGRHTVFASGLWVGAKVNGETRLAVGAFSQEWAAGPLDASGNPVDPNETDPAHRVYKIEPGDGPANPDWAEWPDSLGAPVDGNGDPLVIGEQTLWCVYNDAVASRHTNPAGSTVPLGVEVRQTAFALNGPGSLAKTVFLEFEIENKGMNLLDDAYISFWFDPDLGGFTDDLVGCDPGENLGFCYNATNSDQQYGANPPVVGCVLLKGAMEGATQLGLTSFNRYINGTDPATAVETYNYMQGLDVTGAPLMCDGQATLYAFDGDPLDGSGCLDDPPLDKRMMLNSGPFTMAPGEQQHLVVAILIGGEQGAGERLTNLTALRTAARVAKDAFDRGYQNLNEFPVCQLTGPTSGDAGVPLMFDGSASSDAEGPITMHQWAFGDGQTASGSSVNHSYGAGGEYYVTLNVFDNEGAFSSCSQKVTVTAVDPVELASFEASSDVGQVTLRWVVSHATDHAGFHVARADEIAGVPHAYDRLTDHDTFVTGNGPRFEYVDDTAVVGKAYLYRLEAVGTGGDTQFFGPVRGTPQARVYRFALHQNHPNPFRPAADPATAIRFEVPARSSVTLAIYDVSGRMVRRLVEGGHDPGAYTLRWDGHNDGGLPGSTGIYFYQLVVGDETRTRKLLLLR